MTQDPGSFSIVHFGDSLIDDGNMYDLTSLTLNTPYPPAAYGYAQRFTNGEVWAEVEAGLLNASNYQNYAVGGAEAVGEKTLEDYLAERGLTGDVKDDSLLDYDINLSAQVDRFLADNGGADLSGMTASIMIGSNDYLNFQPQSADPLQVYLQAVALIQDVVTATVTAVTTLIGAGVGNVVVNTLPPAGFYPIIEGLPADLQGLAALAFDEPNAALEAAVNGLNAAGLDVEIVDMAGLASEMVADPSTFGFIAPVEDSVLVDMGGNPASAGYDADQVAFFDEVHPTAAGHGVMGIFHAESLTSEVTIGGGTDDVIIGDRSHDLVLASGGADTVTLSGGDDVALGGLGADTILGNGGNDLVSGGSGEDLLLGGKGDDVLAGGRGDDAVHGNGGDDILIDDLGSDTLRGGNGDDLFLFTEAPLIGGDAGVCDVNVFDGGKGHDTLFLALTETTRATAEASLQSGDSMTDVLGAIGIDATAMEEVVFVEDRVALAEVDDAVLLQEADLWGFV